MDARMRTKKDILEEVEFLRAQVKLYARLVDLELRTAPPKPIVIVDNVAHFEPFLSQYSEEMEQIGSRLKTALYELNELEQVEQGKRED